jgi:hypothetical protein
MIFGNIGAMLAPQSLHWAVAFGIGISVIFLACVYSVVRSRALWPAMPHALVALGVLSILSSLMIIVGRMGYWDTAFVLTSRYLTISVLGIAATYLLTVALAHEPKLPETLRRTGTLLCGIFCLLLLLGLPAGYQHGVAKGREQWTQRLQQREIAQHFESHSDEELAKIYPKVLRERLQYWKNQGLSPFDH